MSSFRIRVSALIKTININILVSLLVSENTPFNFERSVILVIGVSHKENFSMHSLNSFPTLPDFITTYLLLSYMLASIPIHINICARALGFTNYGMTVVQIREIWRRSFVLCPGQGGQQRKTRVRRKKRFIIINHLSFS